MSVSPLVRIFMPLVDTSEDYMRSINGVCALTYDRWELVIVDTSEDGEAAARIAALMDKDARIIYKRRLPSNFNEAFRATLRYKDNVNRAIYVTWLMPGDVYASERLSRAVTVFDAVKSMPGQNAGVLSTAAREITAEGTLTNETSSLLECSVPQIFRSENVLTEIFLAAANNLTENLTLSLSNLIITDEVFNRLYTKNLSVPDNKYDIYGFITALMSQGDLVYIPEPLCLRQREKLLPTDAVTALIGLAKEIRHEWCKEEVPNYYHGQMLCAWLARATAFISDAVRQNRYITGIEDLNRFVTEFSALLGKSLQHKKCAYCGNEPLFYGHFNAYRIVENLGGVWGRRETESMGNYTCPKCMLPDRYRAYVIWLERELIHRQEPGFKILDFAPEPAMSEFFRKHWPNADYKTTDLFEPNVDYKMDIMDMQPIESDSIDFFLCSHILEHVRDDLQAMRELKRILKPDGCGILMIPIDLDQDEYEENINCSREESWRRFGWEGHVRRYSKQSYIERLEQVGFTVYEYGADYFGYATMQENGLDATTTIYVVRK